MCMYIHMYTYIYMYILCTERERERLAWHSTVAHPGRPPLPRSAAPAATGAFRV